MDAKQNLKGMYQFLGYAPKYFGLLHDFVTILLIDRSRERTEACRKIRQLLRYWDKGSLRFKKNGF